MAVIQAVEAIPYRLPMRGELHWGKHGALTSAEYVLVKATLSDGSVGFADAPPRPTIYGETVESIVAAVRWLEPGLTGLEVSPGGWRNPAWTAPLAPLAYNFTAKAALDMALAEAALRSAGQGLPDLLGPNRFADASYILGIGKLAAALDEAGQAFQDGVRVFKVKVGRNLKADLALVRALKAEFGDEARLYADSNETLEPENAAPALAAMAEAGLLWVEEPLPVCEL
ncbi:MAG TPA: enolase C-terminal domain-like protein, partial [Deinococcales bacterium]|nr:enolase C-terminal domain-like protein [Deinococcales bacterium]